MTRHIVVVGSGFAGMWAALSAARLVRQKPAGAADVEITVVSPRPQLVIRPRLYETAFEQMTPDLAAMFDRVGVRHLPASVKRIDCQARRVECLRADGEPSVLDWDRLVLAAGSGLSMPPIPGLAAHTFNVDQIGDAMALERHLQKLSHAPDTAARNTVVVAGGGFTGIETVTEMPGRLRGALGQDCAVRVVLLEREAAVGPDLGPGPRPVIERALRELGIEVRISAAVKAVDEGGVTLDSGERIVARTVVWTAGVRAHPLAGQIPGAHDGLGRVQASPELRAVEAPQVFVCGDVSRAATDDDGHHSLMSCQHAIALGRAAGHNAAADLLGQPLHVYRQPKYVTCLDLGPWGAVYTEGWDRAVSMQGSQAKALKTTINTEWIYPPRGTREQILAAADPSIPVVA